MTEACEDLVAESGDFFLNYKSPFGPPCLVPTPALETRLDWQIRFLRDLRVDSSLGLQPCFIHLHAFYIEGAKWSLAKIARSCSGAELFITTDALDKRDFLLEEVKRLGLQHAFARLDVSVVPNGGRNVWPLLGPALKRALRYPLALHLHVKKSSHFYSAKAWMEDMFECLLAGPQQVELIRTAFACNSSLGLILPRPAPEIRPFANWGDNFEQADLLCKRIFRRYVLSCAAPLVFPAGMMFWFRPEILLPFSDMLTVWERPPLEPLPLDGTCLHAVERLIAHACEAQGFEWAISGCESDGETKKPVEAAKISVWEPRVEDYLRATSGMAARLRDSERECENALNNLKAFENSLSWRATKPLRAFRRFVGNSRSEP